MSNFNWIFVLITFCYMRFFSNQANFNEILAKKKMGKSLTISPENRYLLKDTTHWRRWGSNPLPFGLESSTLPLRSHLPQEQERHGNFMKIKGTFKHEVSIDWVDLITRKPDFTAYKQQRRRPACASDQHSCSCSLQSVIMGESFQD